MGFNIYNKIVDCLRSQPEKRFTRKQIAEWIFENYREDCEKKRQNSTQDLSNDSALIQQIGSEIREPLFVNKNSKIKIITGNPRKFYWPEKSDEQEISKTQDEISTEDNNTLKAHLKEAELYPLLAEFLLTEFNVYSRRIDEKTSKNNYGKGANKWLHPDLVGLEDISNNWSPTIKNCAKNAFSEHIFLWSFEVKLKLNSSNVREAFFQTVSNSSWAHYGY